MTDESLHIFEGHRSGLRPVSRADLHTFYQWKEDLEALGLIVPEGGAVTYEEFAQMMGGLLKQTITLLALGPDGEPIGFVQAFNINDADGWCCFMAYFTPESQRQLAGAKASIAFFDYLFRTCNFRKIYMDIQEFNSGFLGAAVGLGGFVEEGRFREHTWHEGRYWDMVRLTLNREAWPALRERASRILGAVEKGDDEPDHATERRGSLIGRRKKRQREPKESRSELVGRFLAYWSERNIDELLALLADDVVFASPVMGTVQGKGLLSSRLRDQGRWLGISMSIDSPRASITWSEQPEAGEAVRLLGSGSVPGSIELVCTFDTDRKISKISIEGAGQLVTSFYLGV